jgi:membrane associated rhomboid family serine protease
MKAKGTFGILAVLAAVFAVEGARGAVGDERALLAMGALPNDGRLGHEYWRLISYSMLHLNDLHLLLNAALLWWVGNVVERRVGPAALGLAYLASVLSAGAAITLVHWSHPRPGSSVGASGGIFGLVACALVLQYRRQAAHFGQSTRVRLWLWVVAGVGFGASLIPGVSLSGHAGGFAAGLIAGRMLPLRPSPDERPGGQLHPPRTSPGPSRP